MPLIDCFLLLYMATVVKVHDGDTLTIEKDDADKSQVVVRLNRIDAPELKQPYGIESRNYLIDLVLTKFALTLLPKICTAEKLLIFLVRSM